MKAKLSSWVVGKKVESIMRISASVFLILLTTLALNASAQARLLPTDVSSAEPATSLGKGFIEPPQEARPWVYWFWMNGNISREGITKDLESMKRVGIGGVLWMEVSGPTWAPQGPIEAGGEEWHEAMQWAISEAARLDMAFALSIDFGYGSGGPHITPDLSMQKLVWSETVVQGGKLATLLLKRPVVDYRPGLKRAWLRPGKTMNSVVMKGLQEVDSYRDVAVFAVRSSEQKATLIPHLETFDGRGWKTHLPSLSESSKLTLLVREDILDISCKMTGNGQLHWNAPKGTWTVIRLGYASNFKMTRPSPHAAVGLECDRLHPRGMDAHFENRLKPILDGAGSRAGSTLQYIHIDSWEAHGQNWTEGFADEFRKRRGYDLRPWLPVLAGRAVESAEKTERFLWDLRQTVSEVTLARYIDRLRTLLQPYGVQFSCEPYGRLCVDSLAYGGRSDLPIGEFWTERANPNPFPEFSDYWYTSMKGLASVANTYGKPRVGAEAFTGSRGWMDHPYLLKGMGDEAFCNGVSHYVIHLSAHQPYDRMKPGLTHRRWGQHFNRHQTWWSFSKPYFDYVTRCQFLLQQGRRVVDVACLYHEGAPLNFNDVGFQLPPGYDYDFCTPEIVQRMEVKDGRIHLPTGVIYRYLVLPRSGRLTLPTARKIDELRRAGATVYLQSRIVGTPGLEGFPEANDTVQEMASAWSPLPPEGWTEVFASDKFKPDFEGEGLMWIHRRTGGTDDAPDKSSRHAPPCRSHPAKHGRGTRSVPTTLTSVDADTDLYFVANTKSEPITSKCTFRIASKTPELWKPETGEVFALPGARQTDGRTTAVLHFGPAQSWFVVFRDRPTVPQPKTNPFPSWKTVREITGNWNLSFAPDWGVKDTLTIDALRSWPEHSDPLVKYYSGTATYSKVFEVSESIFSNGTSHRCLDLGQVEVMARVTLNGKACGIAWKPPYRVDITDALISGQNKLQIEVVNTWVNRMIGDEQLPLDAKWKDWETLLEWPDWFKAGKPSPTGRYTFTTARHYDKDTPLVPSGLLGPVTLQSRR